ncbi:MAG: ATP-dependent DNA ligase [Candidatus Nanoarchaeia archaeon]
MLYSHLCEVYEKLEKNSSRLIKTEIISYFLNEVRSKNYPDSKEIVYLLQGKVFSDNSLKEFGISEQLCIKAIAKASGEQEKKIVLKWKKTGDLGLAAEEAMQNKKQNTLFSEKLSVRKVVDNLRKLPELVGKGTVERKMALISELLTSASGIEAKYIIRTLLNDLRIGTGSGTIRDSIAWACFGKDNSEIKSVVEAVQSSYDKSTDFGLVFENACKGIEELEKTRLEPGKAIKVMLALKAESIEDGFERVGKPACFEFKYDGFRMMINKDKKGEVKIFTRRLEDVTHQFPEVVKYIKENVKADSFILDSEAVGFDPKTKKYRPFQEISQRIKRKYDIDKILKELPVEVNVFDILYYNGESLIDKEFEERSRILRKIIKNKKFSLQASEQLITSDEIEAQKFYERALLEKQEGVMIKNLKSPYKPGARVGYMLKLKPNENEFDLVIVKAEYGTGKRAGMLSSFSVACRDENNELYELGKVSTGLKEKQEEGLSFIELTDKLKPLITKENGREVVVKPRIVVTVVYQNIQRSPTYNSGFALRFPRITTLREDRDVNDIATIKEIEADYKKNESKGY